MSEKDFISKIQTAIGVTKTELLVVSVLILGLLLGLIFNKSNDSDELNHSDLNLMISKSLDSLAEVEKTTYIGTDIKNQALPELAAADTVVAKKAFYPKKSTKKAPTEKININTASKVQLMKLPGVGEAYANRIIEHRKNSPFTRPEDIMIIKGIGEKRFQNMKEFIVVE